MVQSQTLGCAFLLASFKAMNHPIALLNGSQIPQENTLMLVLHLLLQKKINAKQDIMFIDSPTSFFYNFTETKQNISKNDSPLLLRPLLQHPGHGKVFSLPLGNRGFFAAGRNSIARRSALGLAPAVFLLKPNAGKSGWFVWKRSMCHYVSTDFLFFLG